MEDERIAAWEKTAHCHQEYRMNQVHAERHRAKLRQYFFKRGELQRIDEMGGQENNCACEQCVCAPSKFDLARSEDLLSGPHGIHHADVIIDHCRKAGSEQGNPWKAAAPVGEPSHHFFVIDAEKRAEEVEHEIRESHRAFSRHLEINRIQVHPCPLQGDAKENRIFPDPAKFLEQVQQHWEHQVKLDADKNEVQMVACFARCQFGHERFKQQRNVTEAAEKVRVQPEIEHREYQIWDEDVQQPFLIELQKQLNR